MDTNSKAHTFQSNPDMSLWYNVNAASVQFVCNINLFITIHAACRPDRGLGIVFIENTFLFFFNSMPTEIMLPGRRLPNKNELAFDRNGLSLPGNDY